MFNLISLSIYKIVLEVTYILVISKVWSYLGSTLEFSIDKYLMSWVVFFIICIMIRNLNMKRNMHFAIYILILISCIPGISLYGLKNIDTRGYIYFCTYWILMIFNFYFLDKLKIKFKRFELRKWKKIIELSIIFLFAGITIFTWGRYAGFKINLTLDVETLRNARMNFREIQLPTLVNYLLPMGASIIFPFFSMKYIKDRNRVKFIMVLILTIIAFSIKGMKSWLLYVLIAIFIYSIFKKYNSSKVKNILILSFIFIVMIGTILSILIHNIKITNMISYRTLFLPSEINFDYYNFFSGNEALYLRQSIMSGFFESPYLRPIGFIIGELVTGNFQNNANNGLFGDAFANFKELGILLYPFLIAVVFKITDSLGKYFNQNILKGLIICLVWGSINVSFFTWLLTGGVILTWILIIFLNEKSMTYEEKNIVNKLTNINS